MAQAPPAHVTADLEAALHAERDTVTRLREIRGRLAEEVTTSVAAGVSYHQIARISLRARTGRSPTVDERKREAARLRQVAHRRRVTCGHGDQGATSGTSADERSPSPGKGERIMSNENTKLIERTTITERFAAPEDLAHGRETDDLDGEDDDDEDEDADQKPRRR